MKVCITADDYGRSAEGNAAIEALARRGALSAVSVMTHADAVLDGEALVRLRGTGVALGLHLVLTRERPLLPATPLVDGQGRLPGWPALFVRLVARPSLRALLKEEAAAQRERYLGLGLPLDLLNGHEHVHLFPLVWPLVAELFEETPGLAVRSAHHQRASASRQGLLALSSRLSWALRPPRTLRGATVLSPLGVDDTERLQPLSLAPLLRLARSLASVLPPTSLPELVIHPVREAWWSTFDITPLLAEHGLTQARGPLP